MSKVKNELEELSFRVPRAARPTKRCAPRSTRNGGRQRESSNELKATIAAKLSGSAGTGHQHRRAHQAPVQHQPEAEAAEDRTGAGVRLRRAANHHRQRQGLLRRARHHPPDVVARARPHQGLHRDAEAERLPIAAHLRHQRARHAVRGPDPDDGDAPDGGRRHRRALEIQGGPGRRPEGRAVLPVDAPAARVPAGASAILRNSSRTSRSICTPRRSTRSRRRVSSRLFPAAPRRSTSRTPSTPTSVISAWAPASTDGWCRSART